jgi:hypothetical protein
VFVVSSPREETETGERAVAFRPQVVALAVIGAMALGIQTAVEPTAERISLIQGVGNKAVQWAGGLTYCWNRDTLSAATG